MLKSSSFKPLPSSTPCARGDPTPPGGDLGIFQSSPCARATGKYAVLLFALLSITPARGRLSDTTILLKQRSFNPRPARATPYIKSCQNLYLSNPRPCARATVQIFDVNCITLSITPCGGRHTPGLVCIRVSSITPLARGGPSRDF